MYTRNCNCVKLQHWNLVVAALNANKKLCFSNFSCRFLNPDYIFQSEFSIVLYVVIELRNLQKRVKKGFCFKKIDLKAFSRSLEHFFSHSMSEQFCKQNTISIYSVRGFRLGSDRLRGGSLQSQPKIQPRGKRFLSCSSLSCGRWEPGFGPSLWASHGLWRQCYQW